MGVAEMLERLGSSEVAEWIAELALRDHEEREAMKQPQGPPRVMGG